MPKVKEAWDTIRSRLAATTTDVSRIYELRHKNVTRNILLAKDLIQAGKYPAAKKILLEITSRPQDVGLAWRYKDELGELFVHIRAFELLSAIAVVENRKKEAEEYSKQADSIKDEIQYLNDGLRALRKGIFFAAVASFYQALSINPNSTTAIVSMGYVKLLKGELPDSLNYFNQALASDEGNAEALEAKAHVLELMGLKGPAAKIHSRVDELLKEAEKEFEKSEQKRELARKANKLKPNK